MKLLKDSSYPRKLRGPEVGDGRRTAKYAATRKLLKPVMALSLLSAWAVLSSCTLDPSSETHTQREVEHLQKLTIPPDSRLIDQHPPAIQGSVTRADWEFETNWTGDAYKSWVTEKLQPDFHSYGSPTSPTRFTKYEQGDAEMLSVATAPLAGMMRVTIKLEIYPD